MTVFSEADWSYFLQRSEAIGVSAQCDVEAFKEPFERIYAHLCTSNESLNLTRITDARGYLIRHALDSLTFLLVPCMRNLETDVACVDLGSGGGYPGLPLILSQPAVPWVLVDSRGKKVQHLQDAISLTESSVAEARHFRGREAASAASDLQWSCQVVTARAVGQTDKLMEEAKALLEHKGHLVLAKGPGYKGDEERRARSAAKKLGYHVGEVISLQLEDGDPERYLLVFQRM